MNAQAARIQFLLGSVVLVGAVLTGLLVLLSPQVARPAARIASAFGSALDGERADDLVSPVESLQGLEVGLPVFLGNGDGATTPIAHVVTWGADAERAWVRLRFEPGVDSRGPWKLHAYAPSRKLRAALETAVTQEGAARFGELVLARLRALWQEAILPEARSRLPAFLGRIDPREDTEARALLQGLSKSMLAQLDPLLDALLDHVTNAVKRKFDLLDRLGMLWKVVKGDAKALKRQLVPVAKEAAQQWWAENEAAVLAAVGRALADHADGFRDWAAGELFHAAREELIEPIFAAQQERIEADGQALLRAAAEEFVTAPGGGFRVRFAAVLRTNLLNKKTALLLLEREVSER